MQPSFTDILHEILREEGKPIEICALKQFGKDLSEYENAECIKISQPM